MDRRTSVLLVLAAAATWIVTNQAPASAAALTLGP